MNTILHKAHERGRGDYGWLNTRYSFSFTNWYNKDRMGFGALRVLNDDRIAPGTGFGTHAHENMEIITIVTSGSVTHTDSMGNTGTVQGGEVQVMSAGTGVEHSEYNDSPDEELALFQLWIQTREDNLSPRYEQKSFVSDRPKERTLLVSPDARDGSLRIQQDTFISTLTLSAGASHTYTCMQEGNGVYVFVRTGSVTIGTETIYERDALGVWDTDEFTLTGEPGSEVLLIEVPV